MVINPKILLVPIAGSIAGLSALVVMSGSCATGPCGNAVTTLGDCWQLSLDECLETYYAPEVTNREFVGDFDDGYATGCNGCNLQSAAATISVTWGETSTHDICFHASAQRVFLGFKLIAGTQYCWSKSTSQEVQLQVNCVPGAIVNLYAVEHRERGDVEYKVEYKRRITFIPAANQSDCPPLPPGPDPQIIHIIPCGTKTFSQQIDFKSWSGNAIQEECGEGGEGPYGHD